MTPALSKRMNEVEHEPGDTILTLPDTNAADIITRCREAALEFINESKHWGKPELGIWLTASYAPLTKHTRKDEETTSPVWPVPFLKEIDLRLVDRIMQSARAEIFESLQHIANDGSASFVLRALIAGSVVRCEDGASDPVWVPTGNASRLADRVLSLFAVDYLARPGDYETALVVCGPCEQIRFDEESRRCAHCQPANRQSLLASRGRLTLPYPPLGA